MKKLILILIIFCPIISFAQDLFPTKRLTSDPGREGFPSWSPDGKHIVYQFTDRNDTLGYNGLWIMSADGKNKKQILKGVAEHPKWSPDGKYIVYDADTGRHMRMIPAEGGDPIEFLPDTVKIFRGGLPCWSPDSKQIAFIDSNICLCVIDIKTGKTGVLFYENGMVPLPACWTKDGNYILTALMDRYTRECTIWKFSVYGNEHIQIKGHHKNFYRHLALSPDESSLIYAVHENRLLSLQIMSLQNGKSINFLNSPGNHTEGPCWSPDGLKVLFNRTENSNADVWITEINTNELKHHLNMK